MVLDKHDHMLIQHVREHRIDKVEELAKECPTDVLKLAASIAWAKNFNLLSDYLHKIIDSRKIN